MTPQSRRHTASDGLSLHYRLYEPAQARATAILCIPGLTRHSGDFERVAERLAAQGRRVVCPDLRGRGRSDHARDWRTYDPAFYLDDLRALLVVERLHRVVVIGTSMGGLLGMAMGAAMPGALAGLVVNDIGPDIDMRGRGRILAYVAVDRPQPDWKTAAAHLHELLPNLSVADEEGWLRVARNTYREGADGKLHFDWDVRLARAVADTSDIDLWALWRGVRGLPILALRGGASDILSAATFARMKETKPDLAQVELPGVGHTPTLEEPASTEAIDEFLRRHDL